MVVVLLIYFFLSGNVSTGGNSATNGVYNNHPVTVTSLNGYVTIGYRAHSYDPRNYTTMLNEGTTALPYEPTTTNIYLDEPIEENESISLSDTDVSIPTIRGTNVLTVNTAVQPSKVYIKISTKDVETNETLQINNIDKNILLNEKEFSNYDDGENETEFSNYDDEEE